MAFVKNVLVNKLMNEIFIATVNNTILFIEYKSRLGRKTMLHIYRTLQMKRSKRRKIAKDAVLGISCP